MIFPQKSEGIVSADITDNVVSDGVEDVTVQLNAALALGQNISLARGGTYLISNTINVPSGVTLYGNGATIKRAPQKSSTTATALVSGVTVNIVVADITKFRIGQRIVAQEIAVPGNYDQNPRVIGDINGNTIILTTTVGITAAGGANIYIAYPTLNTAGDNLIDNVVFDGNKANFPFARWEWGQEIHVLGSRNVIRRCRVHDTPGEGLTIASGIHNRISNCNFNDLNGNGIHLSGSNDIIIENVSVENCNLDTDVGHADGAIIWSNLITDVVVKNCYVDTTPLAAIGSIDSADNSDVTIEGCTFRNCGRVLDGIAGSATDVPVRMNWINNRIYDCVIFEYRNTAVPTNFLGNLICTNNFFSNTKVLITRAKQVTFSNNEIADAGDVTAVEASFQVVTDLTCQGNRIEGGLYGIFLDGACQNILVQGNVLKNQNLGAIRLESTFTADTCIIGGNAISNAAGANASYFGILPRARTAVVDNVIDLTGGGGDRGIFGTTNSRATGNTVIKGAATSTMRIDAGQTGVVFGENFVTTAAVDVPGTNTIRNEVIIP